VLDEIDTAGCVLVIPSGPKRVSSLCESGRIQTVTLDAQDRSLAPMSDPFFDADTDPVFVQGVPITGALRFLSFPRGCMKVDSREHNRRFKSPGRSERADRAQNWRRAAIRWARFTASWGKLFVPCIAAAKAPTERRHRDLGV